MRNLFRHTLIFHFYLAGLSLLLHSFIPHPHHYGNEPDHLLNELRKEGLHYRDNDSDNVYLIDNHNSYVCHFNPQVFPGKDDLAASFFIQTEGSRILPLFESDIIKSFYGVKGYDSLTLSNQSSRAPPFRFI